MRSHFEILTKILDNEICYDERISSLFSIARIQYLCSNIPSQIISDSIGVGTTKIAIATTDPEKNKLSRTKIISTVWKQRSTKSRIKQCLRKIYGRNI